MKRCTPMWPVLWRAKTSFFYRRSQIPLNGRMPTFTRILFRAG